MAFTAKPRPATRRAARLFITTVAAAATVGLVAPASTASAEVWDDVAQCESGGNWSINTGNGFYGGLQFTYSTWKGYGGQTYASYAHRASKAEQIAIARRTLYGQGPGAWPVCSQVAGLTRTNGRADPNAMPGDEGGPSVVTRYVSARSAANVRSAPRLSATRVGSRSRGTQVSGTLTNGWLKIGNRQYISSAVLSSSPITGKVTRYVSARVAANVRSGPGTGYRVVDTVRRGNKVTGTLSNGWLKIGTNRWIGSAVLSKNPV